MSFIILFPISFPILFFLLLIYYYLLLKISFSDLTDYLTLMLFQLLMYTSSIVQVIRLYLRNPFFQLLFLLILLMFLVTILKLINTIVYIYMSPKSLFYYLLLTISIDALTALFNV